MLMFISLALAGLIILGVSAMFGGAHDIAHDIAHDFGHAEQSGDGGAGLNLLSVRAIAAFMVAFGGAGAVARSFDMSYWGSSLIGFIPGVLFMFAAAKFFQILARNQYSELARAEDCINKMADVIIEIPEKGIGKIQLKINDKPVIFLARSESGEAIPSNAMVKIVDCPSGGTVIVQKV
ncbi:MAG: hypothetical protein ABFD82_10620 [Syntrophaceae bacterium]